MTSSHAKCFSLSKKGNDLDRCRRSEVPRGERSSGAGAIETETNKVCITA